MHKPRGSHLRRRTVLSWDCSTRKEASMEATAAFPIAAIPAPAELDAARSHFLNAYDAAESVGRRVGEVESASDDDLGRLGRFLLDLDRSHQEHGELLGELRGRFATIQR